MNGLQKAHCEGVSGDCRPNPAGRRHEERQFRHDPLYGSFFSYCISLELLGITGYIPAIQFPNTPEKYGFTYNPQQDAFVCPEGKLLTYHRLNCNQSTGKYLRCYQASCTDCSHCGRRKTCFETNSNRRRVLASSCYPAFFRGHSRVGTPAYLSMMRLRKIWAEGSFSVLKREHCLSKIRKRGIPAVTEECLLSVMALNLKRMVKASFFLLSPPLMCRVGKDLLWNDYFVNRSKPERSLMTADIIQGIVSAVSVCPVMVMAQKKGRAPSHCRRCLARKNRPNGAATTSISIR